MSHFRLDFVDFELNRPNLGNCENDRMVISGQNSNSVIPPICGFNAGQHRNYGIFHFRFLFNRNFLVYVDVDGAQGPFTIRIITNGLGQRRWNILISQIECFNPSKGM